MTSDNEILKDAADYGYSWVTKENIIVAARLIDDGFLIADEDDHEGVKLILTKAGRDEATARGIVKIDVVTQASESVMTLAKPLSDLRIMIEAVVAGRGLPCPYCHWPHETPGLAEPPPIQKMRDINSPIGGPLPPAIYADGAIELSRSAMSVADAIQNKR